MKKENRAVLIRNVLAFFACAGIFFAGGVFAPKLKLPEGVMPVIAIACSVCVAVGWLAFRAGKKSK